MRKLRFYKESDHRWYVDLPEWEGSKADLEMVSGADSMLEYMSEGEGEVWLYLSDTIQDETWDELELTGLATDLGNGAYYELKEYNGIRINLKMWLCDVTKFVFGDFPKIIYIKKR